MCKYMLRAENSVGQLKSSQLVLTDTFLAVERDWRGGMESGPEVMQPESLGSPSPPRWARSWMPHLLTGWGVSGHRVARTPGFYLTFHLPVSKPVHLPDQSLE